MSKKSGTAGRVLTVGLMLFALFFGAGNLIFPPVLGASAGPHLAAVLAGFLVTGVLLPLATIIAVSTSGEGISGIARRIGPRFGVVMPLAVYLSIGPLYAVPRVATVSYELATRPVLELVGVNPGHWALFVHAAVFFALTVFLAVRPSRMADRIGHWLTPALLVLIAVLCIVVIVKVPALQRDPVAAYAASPFPTGLTQGYLTMDVLAASVFGIVVLGSLRSQGFTERRSIVRAASFAGLLAAFCLAMVYLGLALLGARVDGEPSDGTGLLRGAAQLSLGNVGVIIFAAVVVLACLTTSTGLLSAWSSYSSMEWPRVSFRAELAASTVVSFLLANLGLSRIVMVISPATLLLYPIAITLVVVTLIDAFAPGHLRAAYLWGTICSGIAGLVSALAAVGWQAPSDALARTGLWNEQTGWILPTLVCLAIGLVVDVAAGRWSTPPAEPTGSAESAGSAETAESAEQTPGGADGAAVTDGQASGSAEQATDQASGSTEETPKPAEG